jgi:hypothetical protein
MISYSVVVCKHQAKVGPNGCTAHPVCRSIQRSAIIAISIEAVDIAKKGPNGHFLVFLHTY